MDFRSVPSYLLLAVLIGSFGCAATTRGAHKTTDPGRTMQKTPDSYDLPAEQTGGIAGRVRVRVGEIVETKTKKRITWAELVARLRGARLIYVGETHSSLEHHRVQQRIAGELAKLGPIALAMEMFPRAKQPALDDFVAGKLDEEAFIRASDWYGVWGFDYRLYRELFELAKTHKAPIWALNIDGKIARTVGRKGLDGLPETTRAGLPKVFLGSEQHKNVFMAMMGLVAKKKAHQGKKNPHAHHGHQRLKTIYQAQSLWDEVMAAKLVERVAALDKANDSRAVIVIAGSGHVIYRLGISMRVQRQLGKKAAALQQLVVVPVTVKKGKKPRQVARALGDYLIGVPADPRESAYPELGVSLNIEKGHLVVLGVRPSSPAAKAGLKKGDVIERFGSRPISAVVDLRLELQRKNWGETFSLGIVRASRKLELKGRFELSKPKPATAKKSVSKEP
jgi:aminopeptidase N